MKKSSNKIKECNIVIVGVGGQGLITLLKIIAQAAKSEGYDLATSELHGLSQRGGSVEVHIRFGEKIYSPLVKAGGANLIIALEAQEVLRACYYASKESRTIFLINNVFNAIQGAEKVFSQETIVKTSQKFSQEVILADASYICKKELGTDVVSGIYLIGYLAYKKFLPLKVESIILAIKKIVSEKFLEINLKAVELASKHEKV